MAATPRADNTSLARLDAITAFSADWADRGASRDDKSGQHVEWLVPREGGVHPSQQAAYYRRLLPNGSALDRSLPQVLEPEQHGQHAFELAIEMDLVATEPLQLGGVQRFAEGLLAD